MIKENERDNRPFPGNQIAWPYTGELIDPYDLDIPNEVNPTDKIKFAISENQDICKSICELESYIDTSGNTYPWYNCGTNTPKCPVLSTVAWPWHRDVDERPFEDQFYTVLHCIPIHIIDK